MKNTVGLKRVLYLLLLAVIAGLTILISKSTQISDTLKSLLIPELQEASGQRVDIRSISANLFPLFIEAKGVKVFDGSGKNILTVKRAKGYIGLSGILSRHISLRRLVIDEPEISTNRQQLEEMIKSVKRYLEKEKKTAFKVKVKVIEIIKGAVDLRDDDSRSAVDMKGVAGELVLGENQKIKMSVTKLKLDKEGWPKIMCNVNGFLVLKDDRIEIKLLEIGSYGSGVKSEGSYSKGSGTLKTEFVLLVDSVKRMFNLGQKGEGKISAKGEIRLGKTGGAGPLLRSQAAGIDLKALKNLFIDMKLGGNFYIQTLMELLNVKEKIEGLIDFRGEIKGYLSDISGKAGARLRNGNLFGVDVDSLKCDILYQNGIMKFENASGQLYNGTANAVASLKLPVVDFFTVGVKFHSIDSKPALRLIGWEPEIPYGKVDGELSTSGREFNPSGWFAYKALSAEQRARMKGYKPQVDDFLNRIRDIKGNYSLNGNNLSLSNLQLSTSVSSIAAGGAVDIANKTLNLKSRLLTGDISDLASPYYRDAKGSGEFSGEIAGTFDNPKITGKAVLSNTSIEGYRTDSITSDFTYQKNLLDMRESLFKSAGEEHRMKGRISFPEAKELFELSNPVYDLSATIKNAEFGQFVRIFYKDFMGKGRMNADIKIRGKNKGPDVSGKAVIEKAAVYDMPFDSASTTFDYMKNELLLKNVKILKGRSILTGEGSISLDKKFSYSVSSEKVFIKDLGLEYMPDDTVLSLQSEGHGTFDNPAVTVNARISGGTFKGRNMGSGTVSATIQNRDISLNAALFNERVKLKGKGRLDDKLPWSAELLIQPGKYDFLVSSFLKDVPEDLQLNLEGRVDLKGDRKDIAATGNMSHLTLSLFGQTLSNDSNIVFSLNNRKLSFTTFTIKSGTASFRLQGGMEIGKEYDITLDGSSSLSPLKVLSKKIGYLKGDSDFVFQIKGKWEKPEINGGMNVTNASFGLRDYTTYITSINGYLYTDGDRIVLEKLSGKVGGGNINISGVVYFKTFLINRYYLDVKLDDVTAAVSKDSHVNFNGNFLYRGTPDAMNITGDIKINRARYKDMVDWRTWLFAPKAVEKPKAEVSAFERAEINIKISGSENIFIDNNIARAPVKISGDMLVKGTISKPIIFGRFESTEGYAYFRNIEFKIIFAGVDFIDPNRIKPAINLTAETVITGYTIRLNLEGQMDRFTLSLSSDPHLEEGDILTLLSGGQVGKQLKGQQGGIGAGQAASFLTGKLQDVVEERLRTITGLDRFQVEPYVSSTTGTVSPRVTVSKRLIGENLFVTYATLMGTTEEQVLKVEYLISRNLSLVGVRDEQGILGGDVRFRFEFK